MKQFGGLKLKNPRKKGFTPVYDMIENGKLSLLTYKSLKGFMINLEVPEEHSEYFALKSTRFGTVVTSFILKFAVITRNNDENLLDYNGINKSSESKESFFEEAKLQQQIWKKSIVGGTPEICPSVANFSLFDNANSTNLLHFLQNKTTGETKEVFDYLLTQLYTRNGIGVLVMPTVEKSVTFGDFISAPNGTQIYDITLTNKYKQEAYAYVSAQIASLFMKVGVIHFDLHAGNALIYSDKNPVKIKSLIIDFGRASYIPSVTQDDYLRGDDKETMNKEKDEFLSKFFDIITESERPDDKQTEKTRFIIELLDYIADVDNDINQQLNNYSHTDEYQMDWYKNYPKTGAVPLMTFEILKTLTVSEKTGMAPTTLRNYERQGHLVNFQDIGDFIVPFPQFARPSPVTAYNPPVTAYNPPVTAYTPPVTGFGTRKSCNDDPGGAGCSIMGGRKSRKSRKVKKTKKSKTRLRRG